MIAGNVRDFVDNLYYGEEMYFTFRGRKYFIQGWHEKSKFFLVLDDDCDINDSAHNQYVWEYSSENPGECVKAFLEAPLWEGKAFYAVEKEMTWTEPG